MYLFSQTNYPYPNQDYNNYDASISAGNMNDCYTISPRRSPRFLKTSTPKHTKSPAKSPAVKSTTLRRSLLPTLSEQSEDDTVTDTSSATVTTLNTSKVTPQRSVPPSNNSEGKRNNSSAIETTQRSSAPSVSRRETVRLIESCPIEVDKINLKKASQMAKKHSNPGYSLCLKLIPLLFSDEELALSRGQGFNKAKPGDIRPTLSKKKIELMKDYVKSWCLKHGFNVPLDSKLNDGVTERIAYSRKLLKRQTKD
ncbi:uncharacterized protein LOC134246296 [Saccostrea cucullata]|uniref:uncharacterized protein LOC134246296 n=1 Tax=Saccostrea cuccullata TaxID=36930 RepID=UPI002ED67FE8